MAVPGPVTSDLSAGCNDLIRSGHAVLVASAGDVLETLTAAGHPAG
jgi:DNA processing protein